MENRICQNCGKAYAYHGHKSGDHTKYCSDECAAMMKAKQCLQSFYRHGREKQKAKYNADAKRTEWLKRSVPEGFTYLGDWKPGKSLASFRCEKHDAVIVRDLDAVMRNKSGFLRCQYCRSDWRREYFTVLDRERRKYGDMGAWKAVLEERKAQRKKEAEERTPIFTCQICGKQFKSNHKDRKTCGGECAQTYAKEMRTVRADRRIREGCLVDKNITLKRLYKRDSGICYLCGGLCDWNDTRIGKKGTVCCGFKYPSIDHVIPLAKGGLHSWENVKLAHLGCNLEKSDGLFPNLRPDGERIKTYAIPPKRTEQYTKDGLLIACYDSTAAAARQTGYRAKQIQKCARGECKTYRGFVWRYA